MRLESSTQNGSRPPSALPTTSPRTLSKARTAVIKGLLTGSAVVLLLAMGRSAQATEQEYESLRNLQAVHLTVDVAGPLYGQKWELQQLFDGLFQKVGVPLVTEAQWHERNDVGKVLLIVSSSGSAAIITFSVSQELWQVRDGKPVAPFVVKTWDRIESVDQNRERLPDAIMPLVDEFLRAWKATHRPPTATSR
jgi:hypothetical protein